MPTIIHRIGAFVAGCLLCVHQPATAATGPELAAALEARMATAVAEGFNGSVLIADGDSVLFERQYGITDPGDPTPISADTAFNLASAGKLFTGNPCGLCADPAWHVRRKGLD